MKRVLRTQIVFLAIIIGALSLWRWNLHRGGAIPSSALGAVQDFQLTDFSGQSVTLETLKGKVWVADFIYSRCTGPCPVLSSKMEEFQTEFQSPNFRSVSFTVDPDHDNSAVLNKYAGRFGADPGRWFFLTGEKSDIYRLIRDSFHLTATGSENPKNPGQAFVHSLYFVLVDSQGRIRGYYNAIEGDALNHLHSDIEALLAGQDITSKPAAG